MAAITKEVFDAMVDRGGLIITDDLRRFIINFYIIQQEFSEYLEMMILKQLNATEQQAYQEGYYAYIVLPNGLLEWRYTGKVML